MKIRLLFVDEGSYHQEHVEVSAEGLEAYDRLIDYLREDEAVQKSIFVDVKRLSAAWVVD
jgi:hypothetical protein